MSISLLIAREIEKKLTLDKNSYQTTGVIPSELSFYSCNSERNYLHIDSLDTPIFQGKVVFMYDSFTEKGIYFHEEIINPTVIDLQIALDKGIIFSERLDHVYLEDLNVIQDKKKFFALDIFDGIKIPDFGDAQIISLETGS